MRDLRAWDVGKKIVVGARVGRGWQGGGGSMLAVNVRTRRRKLRPTARLAVANAGVSYAGATAWARLPYRFEDPGESSSNDCWRALLLALPKPVILRII